MRRFATTSLLTITLSACATTHAPRQLEDFLPEGAPRVWDWSRVKEVAPASEIEVTVRGSQPASRYFVVADDQSMIVLNLTDATLPAAVSRVLRRSAAEHPDYFRSLQRSGGFGEENVRVGRDGVTIGGRKVAELGQVVETIARNDVTDVEGVVAARGSVPGMLVGSWIGFALGAVPALGGAAAGVPILIGCVAAAGYLGFRWSTHGTDGTIYRAP